MTATPGATEFRFELNDRGEIASDGGYLADARRIKNVLFGQPRADDANFGLDIRSFLMEHADSITLETIRSRASTLISKYCPGVVLQGFVVEYADAALSPAGRGTNTLVVGISIGTSASNSYDFGLRLSLDNANQVVVSELTV